MYLVSSLYYGCKLNISQKYDNKNKPVHIIIFADFETIKNF